MRKLIKKFVPDFFLKEYLDFQKVIQIKYYRGDKVFCPICNSKFKKFGTFGSEKRENARCYFCGSLERHRLVFKYLSERTNFFNNNSKIRLLHFAPEKSFYDIFSKNQNIDYTPCDLSPEIHLYDGDVKIIKVDITNIPFKENYFDVILCNHVLEHIIDDRKAMSELYRVMKIGQWGIFQVPIDYSRKMTYEDFTITAPKDRKKAFGQSDHVRIYGQDYKDRLKSAGFNVIQDEYIKSFTSEELFRFGLKTSHLIYFCSK
jgi:SAM-dependent methyltransferase